MLTKNLFLRIFFYSILVVSSIHFINIKAMIDSRFNNPFVFENFSARAADDLLPVEFIKYKDPSTADKVTSLSNGMININGISELSYSGTLKEIIDFSFSDQVDGFYGSNIGYFRFNIISPYPEAASVVYVVNNDKQHTYNLVDGSFDIDHPLAEKKDGVNWTPIDWGTQNLLMKFIDKDGNELGIKTLVISNSSIKQQKPTNFITADINPGMLFPLEILNPTILDGSINFGDIVLKTDGTTDNKDLILSKEQMIGLSTNRYFDFSLKLNQAYSSLKFFINGQELQVNNDVFLINSEKEKINVYFAVAKEDFSKNFSPYYEGAQNFNLVVRLLDEKNSIIGEQEVNFSFNIIKESNALAKEFISIKDPKELSNFAKLLTEAQMVNKSPEAEVKTLLLTSVNVEKADEELEKKVEVKHQSLFIGASTPEVKTSLKNYLAYGTESTIRLGEGQRAATVINYTNVKGSVPETESDIEDVLKIANNRVPLIRNSELEPKFLGNFYRLNNIIKENNITKIDENNLILELNQFLRFSYGILPIERSIAREKWAIELFVKNYNKLPQTDGEWRIVNSWAYRNVLISQVENNLDWINFISSEKSEITVELLDEFFELAVK